MPHQHLLVILFLEMPIAIFGNVFFSNLYVLLINVHNICDIIIKLTEKFNAYFESGMWNISTSFICYMTNILNSSEK